KFGRRPVRRGPLSHKHLRLEQLESRLTPSVNVLTFHNDIASTGLNPNETQLIPSNVQVGSFDKLFVTPVDGQVYAEPLVDTGINIDNDVIPRTGVVGTHDSVFVHTYHDFLH